MYACMYIHTYVWWLSRMTARFSALTVVVPDGRRAGVSCNGGRLVSTGVQLGDGDTEGYQSHLHRTRVLPRDGRRWPGRPVQNVQGVRCVRRRGRLLPGPQLPGGGAAAARESSISLPQADIGHTTHPVTQPPTQPPSQPATQPPSHPARWSSASTLAVVGEAAPVEAADCRCRSLMLKSGHISCSAFVGA